MEKYGKVDDNKLKTLQTNIPSLLFFHLFTLILSMKPLNDDHDRLIDGGMTQIFIQQKKLEVHSLFECHNENKI